MAARPGHQVAPVIPSNAGIMTVAHVVDGEVRGATSDGKRRWLGPTRWWLNGNAIDPTEYPYSIYVDV